MASATVSISVATRVISNPPRAGTAFKLNLAEAGLVEVSRRPQNLLDRYLSIRALNMRKGEYLASV